ncbi:hypothetical protein ACH5RR_040956 [Cinchona calisaya]|uniref:Protein KAKU4 n=1 Tax=Cinchona calisaya TaxID=153742 RepID=A0ABD2XSP8_9GENT
MATISGSGEATDARSGGKIMKKRLRRPITTPHQPPQPQESPNWVTGVIFPATRKIATGAVKILSSVFDSSSSSSSSSSSEGAGEDDINNDEVNHSNKDHAISSEAMECIDKEAQLTFRNSVTKSAIERLLMQEMFSWEERNRLVQVIDSRVMDPIVGGEDDGLVSDFPVGMVGNDTADLCGKAVMEARKWLEEKKVGSSPSDLAQESGCLKSELQYIEKKASSPVDVAKFYMRSRPPWASPLAEHIEVQTPSAMRRELFTEGTSAPICDGSLSSSKKRNLASGSWNIEEEIRRVRSKASEDMLSSVPLKLDLSSLRTATRSAQDSFVDDLSTIKGDVGNKWNFMTGTPSVDVSMDVSAGLITSVGISALDARQDGLENETLTSDLATSTEGCPRSKDSEAVKVTGECSGSKSNYLTSLDLSTEHCDDPRSSYGKFSPVEEVREFVAIENVNGLHTSQERNFSGEVGTGEIQGQPHENTNAVKSDVKTADKIPLEDMCELLSEASVEVPIVDDTNGIVSVSQITSSMQYEELSPVLTQPYTAKLVPKADGEAVKQEVKKPGRYNRRGRGRGK